MSGRRRASSLRARHGAVPALLPVPGVIKVRLGFTVGLDTTTGSHLHVGYGASVPSQAQLQTFAQGVWNAYTTRCLASIHTSVALTSVTATDLSTTTSPVAILTGNVPGTRAGTAMPANACVLINQKVTRRYRGGHPRVYLPWGVTGDIVNAQTWTGAFVTSANTAWGLFTQDVIALPAAWGGTGALMNVSYYLKGEWKPDHNGNYHRVPTPRNPPLAEPLVSSAMSATFGSQRRRVRSV